MGMGGKRHAPAALPLGKRPSTQFTGSCAASSVSMDSGVKFHPTRIRPPDRPPLLEPLYRLSYSGPLTDGEAVINLKVSRGRACQIWTALTAPVAPKGSGMTSIIGMI